MASNQRRQLESWLKTIDVKADSVLDVGGLFWPVKGRTKSWDVKDYKILDIKESRNGVKADYVYNLNNGFPVSVRADVIFFLETIDHVWNVIAVLNDFNFALRDGGLLYLSSNFLFPHHTGADYVRYTSEGLKKILTETHFEIVEMVPRYATNRQVLIDYCKQESKVVRSPGEIGYLIKAKKC